MQLVTGIAVTVMSGNVKGKFTSSIYKLLKNIIAQK